MSFSERMDSPEQMHPFAPLPWQADAWRCTDPVMLCTGSAGGGKSHLAAEKLHGFCLRYPGAMALMVRKTRESMVNSTILFVQRRIIGPDPRVVHLPSKHRFEYANGSILAYGGMADEAQREQIRSVGLAGGVDIAWAEEANRLTEDDYNELLIRMRGSAASWRQLILTTNPDAWGHWINQRLIMGAQATVFCSSAADNPANPADYQAMLDMLTGTLRARLRDGLWQTAQGAVYDEFDPAMHIAELAGPWKRVIAGIDEGYTNPCCMLVIGEDGDGRKHVITEFYAARVLQDDVVAKAVSLATRYGIACFYADPSAAGLIAALRATSLGVFPACNDIAAGVATVKAHLRPAADGRPRLTFSELCVNTLREVGSYVWDQNDRRTKETPSPYAADHAMDALRYALHGRTPATESYIIEPPPDPVLGRQRDLSFDERPI